ncbi:AAA family ATPase [Acinetobacter baumannii]|jgi:predicted ATP-dependent endonuclease of OLD family|uniref:AAA family ATPase n=1 Tax=Acinetobacter TaxID=469 RepID=UPI00295610BB|nr:AAA family ATPase [Acinetobacter baumannii]MDV7495561.1 AAA family ATPase [Acinetobacter baumannii]MEB5850675.1 AAA family ATPase [Acinetobacter baumannii]
MRLVKVQVQNYRSIIDSGELDIEKIKTVFVGINEAGKTTLLKAINQLNPASDVEEISLLRDFPRAKYADHIKGKDIEKVCSSTLLVKGKFSLESLDREQILLNFPEIEKLDVDLAQILYVKDKYYQGYNHNIEKFNRFTFSQVKKDILRLNEALTQTSNTEQLIQDINLILQQSKGDNYYISESEATNLKALIEQAEIKIDEDNQKELDRILKILNMLNTNIIYNKLLKYLSTKIPKFVYFNNYIRVKPRIHLERLAQRQENNQLDDKYFDYGNISLLKFLGYSARELANLGKPNESQADPEAYARSLDDRFYRLNAASINLSKSIQEIWNPSNKTDEASNLEIVADGQSLKVVVTDMSGAKVELDQRSEGFQWMVSFFIVFESQADNDYKNCILLLDEPATSLHALKQKEFIKTISKLAEKNQTIYTTHSPFMISQDELDLVRIIELTDRTIGTKVNNKIVSNDPAALFPLQEALGYNLAQSMFTAKKNVLLEGITDLWYLEGVNSLFDKNLDPSIALLPVGTSAKISYYASMLGNNDLKTVALLDSDAAGDKAAEQDTVIHSLGAKNILRTKEFLQKEIKNSEIEDIIRETLAQIFTAKYQIDISEEDKNSDKAIVDIFKKLKKDFSKAQMAKAFLAWARDHSYHDLSHEEKQNCQKLIEAINKRLK